MTVRRRRAHERRVSTERGALLLLVGFGLACGLLFSLVQAALFEPAWALVPAIGAVLVVLTVLGWLLWRAAGPVGANRARGFGGTITEQ